MGASNICLAITLLLTATCARAQDLTSLSFEEFMNIKVSSVNKTPQKLSRTPAAVYVISQEDIRRSGATSLPEVLRLAPGVHVARITGTSWAVGIRGFNGIYSNKLLVMVDGRTIYSALLSGVIWSEGVIMLEDIERIEIIRGPGSTMWGANAVSGVINIITKSARQTEGGLAAISGGSFDPASVRMRYGASLGDNGAWRAWGQYSLMGQTSPAPGIAGPHSWPAAVGGFRLETEPSPADTLLIEGQVQGNSTPVTQSVVSSGGPKALTRDSGDVRGYLMARWEHHNRRDDTTTFQILEDYDDLDAGTFTAGMETVDADVHHSIQLPKDHQLMIGGGGRVNRITTAGTQEFYFNPASATYVILNAYIQDDWTVIPDRLSIEAGVKTEYFTEAGYTLEPTIRVMWTPTARTGFWASTSRAVRTPAHTDYAVRLPVAFPGLPVTLLMSGNPEIRPEVLKAVEAGGRFQVHRSLALDVSLFRHYYNGLLTYDVGSTGDPAQLASAIAAGIMPVIPALTANGMDGVNQGGEVAAHYDVRPGWQLDGSYSGLFSQTSYRPGLNAMNAFATPYYTPKHQWQLRTSREIGRHWSGDLTLRRSGEFPGGALPGYTQMDGRVARRFGESMEFSVSGLNLLRPYQQEFAGQFLYPAGFVRRSVEAGLRWSF